MMTRYGGISFSTFQSPLPIFLLAIVLILAVYPAPLLADYVFPGSAAFQPLAVIEPVTPDSLFYSWTGELERCGRYNFGTSLDILRNPDNSDDQDVIFSATGSFRAGERILYGVTVPYIVRDPDFNESDLLDLRLFARVRILEGTTGSGLSGELSAILPTADEGTPYPFTLDSPVAGVRLAFAGAAGTTRFGVSIGYQQYLQTETGDDSDSVFGLWGERPVRGPWKMTAEYTGSTHTHSGDPGDDEVTEGYITVGVRRAQSDKLALGLSASAGVGGDTAADLRVKALATFRFGTMEKKQAPPERKPAAEAKPAAVKTAPAPVKAKPAPAARKVTAVMIAEGVTDRATEKRVTRALQDKGYATGMDPDPGIRSKGRNVLYYMPGMQDQAISVSRTLTFGGHLKDLRIEESPVPITGNWLLLVLGGE